MKKKIFFGIIFTIITSISVFGCTWELIKEKTWGTKHFPTEQIVFYESLNGLKKAIYQLNGSGRCAVRSFIYDIELKGDSIYLIDALDLEPNVPSKKRESELLLPFMLYLKNEVLILENLEFTKVSDLPLICNWLETYSGNNIIPIEKLKAIPIQKKMIYDKHTVNFGPNPENCGIDNNPALTEAEAIFLNEYLSVPIQLMEFDFNNKKILFVTGSNGRTIGSKNAYFDNIKEWKVKHNSKIATSLIVLADSDKMKYGYDAILTYWVKVLINSKVKNKILQRANERDKE
ncbi:MAG: hypothetical protein LBP67_04195 [Bacteroidales bacterium]|jgi:hypothetical protein|nr:hypothetical protein [Bacteroidales bacterium]